MYLLFIYLNDSSCLGGVLMKIKISSYTQVIFLIILIFLLLSTINLLFSTKSTLDLINVADKNNVLRKLLIISSVIQEILIITFAGLVLFLNERIRNKSLKQELEKARINAELIVANDMVKKEEMILEQKAQIEKQNIEILQQKILVDTLYRDAIESNKAKTEFFSNIAHELKTPVSVILSTMQLMNLQLNKTESIDKTKQTRYLDIVKQNSYRIIKLINSLLQITKVEAGFIELNPVNIDIIKITRDICFSVSEYIKTKDIEFEFQSTLNKKVIAIDPDKFERIMLNLLANAVKFTSAGGKIRVGISCNNNYVSISVKDSGIGIPKEKLGTIFDRYKQARTSQTKHFEGFGIGLSLVKSFIELHSGNIEVQSEVGKGTEFKVFLQDKKIAEPCNEINNQDIYQLNGNTIAESINIEFSEIYSLN